MADLATTTIACAARRCFGLVSRRERWGLTGRAWCLAALVVAVAVASGIRLVHPFLAVTAPVATSTVAVEAWMPAEVLKGVAERFESDAGAHFFCVGGPTDEHFDSTRLEDTSAVEAVQLLQRFGVGGERLTAVPVWVPRRDRTYASAVALRDWLRENNIPLTGLNVVTEGLHARRSRLLFEKAFGDSVAVGVIAIPDPTYDARRWWRYSEGVKSVISESAGYLYVRLFFRPEKEEGERLDVHEKATGGNPSMPDGLPHS